MNHPRHVLVVDDNPANLDILEEMLVGEEYVVHTASSAAAALQIAKRQAPQLVILDVMMPGMDGCALCRRLRESSATARARIVMVTAKAMPSEEAAGYAAGADAYITKPFDDAEVIAAIREKAER